MAIDCVGIQPVDHLNHMFHLSSSHDFNVSTSYNKTISTLKPTGHARFRRAPSTKPDSNEPSTSSESEKKQVDSNISVTETMSSSSRSMSSSSYKTSSGLEITVSNGKHVSSLGIVPPAPVFSLRKLPLPATHWKRCITERPVAYVHKSGSGCHC
ncbi:putative WRKY transcription factor, plant [Helianthus debilis subsp. tardiflorus]